MAKLTAAKRKKIPKKEFGMPGEKKYPMEDKSHARNAKARAPEMPRLVRQKWSTKGNYLHLLRPRLMPRQIAF